MSESIRDKVDRQIYKADSNADQRDEACRFAIATVANAKIDHLFPNELGVSSKEKSRLLCEIERSALMLILERDAA